MRASDLASESFQLVETALAEEMQSTVTTAVPTPDSELIELTVNYRTPSEVMNFAAEQVARLGRVVSAPASVRSSGVDPEVRRGTDRPTGCTVRRRFGGGAMSDVSSAETTRMLAGMPLFAGLTKRQLGSVAKAVDHASFEPGFDLVTEREEVQRLIIIRDGTAAVMRRGVVAREGGGLQEGSNRRLGTVGPGDVVGELSLIDGHVASASVVAETPIDALLLYRTRFHRLLATTPELYPRLLVGMAARIRAIDRNSDLIG